MSLPISSALRGTMRRIARADFATIDGKVVKQRYPWPDGCYRMTIARSGRITLTPMQEDDNATV